VSTDSLFPVPFSFRGFIRRETDKLNSVPVVGMLCGPAIAGVLVSLSFILKELE
jgi:hypothetical protein